MKENLSFIIRDIICFVVIIAVVAVLVNVVFINGFVPTASMEPTLHTKGLFLGDRLAYRHADPERYDVIVFHAPDTGELYVKRVIGLPGEHLYIQDNKVYVNGDETDSEFVNGTMDFPDMDYGIIPEDSYFMMGDNRNNSQDSRFWVNTFLKKDEILGKVWFTYWPEFKKVSEVRWI